ncbi:MAG: RluA family pseudouridine synthase [Candidatus Kapabacteria bacterium]|nr:RluA family pseudouridine synthase [Candidatus Kapabacteria bacterium]
MSEERDQYPGYIEKEFTFLIPKGQGAERIDLFLSRNIENATRTKIHKSIEAGRVLVNGKVAKSSKKIQPNDLIKCTIMKAPPLELLPENIPLDIAFEDSEMIVVNKPAGMVTHPGVGNRYGTLVNAILYHLGHRESIPIKATIDDEDEDENEVENDDETDSSTFLEPNDDKLLASELIRPGIVHRLDKDTSGLMVVSKNPVAHNFLANQFKERTSTREYLALVWGKVQDDSGTIEGNIDRSPRDRKKFAISKKGGKYARTDFEVVERFTIATLLKVRLKTGRTHQIRVHFSENNHPLVSDVLYGGEMYIHRGYLDSKTKSTANKVTELIKRHALHARLLGVTHPITKEFIEWETEPPLDFQQTLDFLRKEAVLQS